MPTSKTLNALQRVPPKTLQDAKKDNQVNDDEININTPSGVIYFNLKQLLRTNLEHIIQVNILK